MRSTKVFLYLRQSFSSFPRGLDLLKQVEKEQLGVPAGYEAMRRLHQELSVYSWIEASSLREEILRFTTPKAIANRPLEVFRCVQVELAKFQRLTAGFPDLALTEADSCMVMLRNLSVETKKYILLHAKIDSLSQLESALRFYDSNLRILDFQDRSGKGEHANPLQFDKNKDRKGKDNKGKDKGKDNKEKKRGKTRTARARGMKRARTARETRVTRRRIRASTRVQPQRLPRMALRRIRPTRRSALFAMSRGILPGIAPMPPRDLEREAGQSQRERQRFSWSLSCVPPCIM